MNILLIGGTGKTGRQIVKQGLEQGHKITVIARQPKKLKLTHSNLYVHSGNVLDFNSIEKRFNNQDAVISALGHKRFIVKTTILSEGTKNVIKAMDKHGIKRFICITSLGINDRRFKLGLYYTLFVIPFLLLFYFLDKEKQERLIINSDLDWTIVRPGQLTNGEKRTIYKHGSNLGSYIITRMISRADVAHFILKELMSKQYFQQKPAVIY
jgi:putative NADH-flavin reductase